MSKNSCILLRASSSASSSSRVAIPNADDSSIPVIPEPNPLRMSSGILESAFVAVNTGAARFFGTSLARLRSLSLSTSASTSGELGSSSSGISFRVNPS